MLILQKDAGVLRTGGRGCQLRRPTVSCKLPLASVSAPGSRSSVHTEPRPSRSRPTGLEDFLEELADVLQHIAMSFAHLQRTYSQDAHPRRRTCSSVEVSHFPAQIRNPKRAGRDHL